jgi:hypothetical protein
MSLLDDLSDDVRAGRVVVVAGAGVSLASTKNAKDWPTLLGAGVKRALEYNQSLPEEWRRIVDVELDTASTYPAALPGVASKIVDALGGRTGPELAAWLRHEFSALRADDPTLIDAIDALGVPLLTTNFDHLFEHGLGREPATWRSPSQMQSILQGRTRDVGHLHGSWRDPESVILGDQSYGELIGNASARAIQEALTAARTMLFIGCGAGIADPNFQSLRSWMKTLWSGSEGRHYRLCMDSEVDPLLKDHDGERIVPLGIGPGYDDLPSFLTGLGSVSSIELVSAASAPAISAKALDERIVSEAVLTEHVGDDSCSWERLTIPPVLLPVPHDQFVRSQDLPREERPRRLDPNTEALRSGVTVLIADDRVGLTTALEWLTLRRHAVDGRAVPVVIDFKHISTGPKPLRKQLVKDLRVSGVPIRDNAELPLVTLALDNFSSRPEKICGRVIEEIRTGNFDHVIIGCKQGQEKEALGVLDDAGIAASIRYVGRLNQGDIEYLAGLVAPGRQGALATKAIEIVNREHLPRTPFTLSLLISAILHGEALLSTASETALLDAYISLLLGRGDPHDDARFSLDAHERADILATFAEVLVRKRVGSLPESEVLEVLDDYFNDVDWNEDPMDVLGNLRARHLLAIRSGHIAFTQASYLHLFAAKRAMASQDFLDLLLRDPLYYAPIVGHYAALTRDDQKTLETVEKLLWGDLEEPTDSISFANDAVALADSVEELVARLNIPDHLTQDPDENGRDADGGVDWLDQMDDSDTAPFPLDRPEDAPPATRVIKVLTTVSNVLRDSELVRDSALKQRVLQRALFVWGRFVVLLENDEEHQAFVTLLVSRLAEDMGLSEKRKQSLLEVFREIGPLLTGFGGMSSTLASRKLSRSLNRCFGEESFQEDAPSLVMGALLALTIQDVGWASYFRIAGEKHRKVRVVRRALKGIALTAYYHQTLSPTDSEHLEAFLVDQYMVEMKSTSAVGEKTSRERLAQQLRTNRLRFRNSRLPAGETAYSARIEVEGESGASLALPAGEATA